MIKVEITDILGEFIEEEKEELYSCIRRRRTNLLEIMSKVPINELVELQKYMNTLNAMEYLLMKGEENDENK